nr:hypothetical protein [Candidatus Sigynarchaeota archaeon]
MKGNKAIIKHLPTFLTWIEESRSPIDASMHIQEFLERRYQTLFPPGKIRRFKDASGETDGDGQDKIRKESGIPSQQESMAEDIAMLKQCFIESSYWRKVSKELISNCSFVHIVHPSLLFMKGIDKDVKEYPTIAWSNQVHEGWAKAAMATGSYFFTVMMAEILLLGNKGLQKALLSTIKSMCLDNLVPTHELITRTSVNVLQRMHDAIIRGKEEPLKLAELIKRLRKTSAVFLEDHVLNGHPTALHPVLVQFYFMAGMLIADSYEKVSINVFTGDRSFTPRGALMYVLGRVVQVAGSIEVASFKSRAFMRVIPLYRSIYPLDWMMLFLYCMRVLVRKAGSIAIEEYNSGTTKERLSSLYAGCKTISRLHQWLRDRLGI